MFFLFYLRRFNTFFVSDSLQTRFKGETFVIHEIIGLLRRRGIGYLLKTALSDYRLFIEEETKMPSISCGRPFLVFELNRKETQFVVNLERNFKMVFENRGFSRQNLIVKRTKFWHQCARHLQDDTSLLLHSHLRPSGLGLLYTLFSFQSVFV